jgi:hypothetical protein
MLWPLVSVWLPSLRHTTTNPPAVPTGAATGVSWPADVYELTWNCPPSGVPEASKRWPWTLPIGSVPSPSLLRQTTTKFPEPIGATAA